MKIIDEDSLYTTDNSPVVAFDVDQTLVMWEADAFEPKPGRLAFNSSDRIVYLTPHYKHIFYLKTYKKRGFRVLIWSAAGGAWANEVIKVLGLEDYVHLSMNKLTCFYDDLKPDQIMGEHLYFLNNLDGEEWKHVVGYEGKYEVSSYGRIRSIDKSNKKLIKTTSISSTGYVVVQLTKNKKCKTLLVHRLVCDAFLPKIKNKNFVNHKDGRKDNNNLSNLEWVNLSENSKKKTKYTAKRYFQGSNNPSTKLTEKQVLDIYYKVKNKISTAKILAKEYNITTTQIYYIQKKKSWKLLTDQFDISNN